MSEKFQNKYRIPSARLSSWDYGSEAWYFITIVVGNRRHFFGEIEDGEMILNEIGRIVNQEWTATFEIRKDMNLEKGAFVVMPNHFHALLKIGANKFNFPIVGLNKSLSQKHREEAESLPKNEFGPQFKNLASIVRGFKSAVTSAAIKMKNPDFFWHPRFHDHVVRNKEEFFRIRNYIINNPKNWKEDKFC